MCVYPVPPSTLPFTVKTRGPSTLVEPLSRSLKAQWAFGFPLVPKPAKQLTHGFLQYPAGMQAVAAAHLLEVLPSGVLLDPFVGGGATLIEAMRCGWQTIGADVSPLALFASAHHTWLQSDAELERLRDHAVRAVGGVEPGYESRLLRPSQPAELTDDSDQARRTAARPKRQSKGDGSRRRDATTWKSWSPLREELERLTDPLVVHETGPTDRSSASLLWFCYAAAQQRAERYRYAGALESFEAAAS